MDSNTAERNDEQDAISGYDSLTGLPNRTLFLLKVFEALDSAHQGDVFAILSLQLDHFSAVHAKFGESVAQQLLGAVAGRIQHNLSAEDFLARVQHHEFAILLMDIVDVDEAKNICKQIQDSFESPFKLEDYSIDITVSIGVAIRTSRQCTPESLLHEAHAAACLIKRQGGGRFVFSTFSPGTYLGRFEITSFLAKGGMGEVYCAHDPILDREVAIKILNEDVSKDPVALKRFQRELRAVAALTHPNIVSLYDIGTFRGRCYAVMERLRGETLREILKTRRMPPWTALEYAIQISEGLGAAHEKGIAHRDLKPENIFITQDRHIKLLDFGLARFIQSQQSEIYESTIATVSRMTEPGMILGTIGYMSPEQILGELTDERSDIFSFGAVLYEMLCGRHAFEGSNKIEILNSILKEEPRKLSSNRIPEELRPILCKCLRKAACERFPSAGELTIALKMILSLRPLNSIV